MKTVAKIAGAVVVIVVLVLVVLRITGFNPIGNTPGPGNYPGLWLSGTAVSAPVTDWSFVNQYQTDKLQTRTWYLIPHSVTTSFIVHDGQLYLTSGFRAGRRFPEDKSWTTNVMRDPHVRLKFGNNLYDCRLSHVTDPAERAAVLGPRAKNPIPSDSVAANVPVTHIFRVVSDRAGA